MFTRPKFSANNDGVASWRQNGGGDRAKMHEGEAENLTCGYKDADLEIVLKKAVAPQVSYVLTMLLPIRSGE